MTGSVSFLYFVRVFVVSVINFICYVRFSPVVNISSPAKQGERCHICVRFVSVCLCVCVIELFLYSVWSILFHFHCPSVWFQYALFVSMLVCVPCVCACTGSMRWSLLFCSSTLQTPQSHSTSIDQRQTANWCSEAGQAIKVQSHQVRHTLLLTWCRIQPQSHLAWKVGYWANLCS